MVEQVVTMPIIGVPGPFSSSSDGSRGFSGMWKKSTDGKTMTYIPPSNDMQSQVTNSNIRSFLTISKPFRTLVVLMGLASEKIRTTSVKREQLQQAREEALAASGANEIHASSTIIDLDNKYRDYYKCIFECAETATSISDAFVLCTDNQMIEMRRLVKMLGCDLSVQDIIQDYDVQITEFEHVMGQDRLMPVRTMIELRKQSNIV